MRNSLRHIQLLLTLSLISVCSVAQNISQPYSILGIGDLEDSYFNRNSGMANTGLALRSDIVLYQANPASFSALTNQFFTFETAVQGKTVTYTGLGVNPESNTNGDVTFKKVTAGIKLTKRWGSCIGFTPFSSVNYTFSTSQFVPGGTGASVYDGNGGINQVFFANAYRISKNFSVGINSAYLFGGINQTQNIEDPNSQSVIASTKNTYYRKFNFTYGLQYFAKVTKHWDYNLGMIYSPVNTLNGETSLLVTDNTQVIRNQIINNVHFTLPATYGIGMALTHNDILTYAADYKYQAWSDVNAKETNLVYTNSHRVSVGVDYTKLKNAQVAGGQKYTYEKYNIQAGAFFNASNLLLNGRQINEYGLTLGGGKPVSGGKITLNLALQLGSRGTTKNNLIKETYGQLTLNISYRDVWYTKGRKFD